MAAERVKRIVRSVFLRTYYRIGKPSYGLSEKPRDVKVTVSVTSYTPRLEKLVICLKSILNQTVKPDRIVVYLGLDVNHGDIPDSLFLLQKYGVTIKEGYENIKPHKKYFYAMQEFPNDLIITVDDDGIYDKNLIKSLLQSYKKYPTAISACRVHKIVFNENGIAPYNEWKWDDNQVSKPRFDLMATGVGGVLYPPHILPEKTFDISYIKEHCLNADDIWLKMMEIMADIPVVWAQTEYVHPIALDKINNSGLNEHNVLNGENDIYIKFLWNDLKLTKAMFEPKKQKIRKEIT